MSGPINETFDVVIVGGGITGGALAIVLARAGVRVKILERDRVYQDRVRGEFMACWGVAELQRLNLADILTAAGGAFMKRVVPYDETLSTEMAQQFALDLTNLAPGLPPAFCMGHPAMCEALNQAALGLGVVVSRGVKSIKVQPGERPEISYQLDGAVTTLRPRLIVGADGRNSVVRKQIGVPEQKDPPHNLLGGILVEGETDWVMDDIAVGTEGDVHYLIFPQGGQRLRLYLCFDFAERARFTGPDKARNWLDAFRLDCLPHAEQIAACTPIGPVHSYSNEDHWTDQPTVPGVVLIGDAAGHVDPITGQGLSIGLRDVRQVSEILAGEDWRQAAFAPYVEARMERLRRLRVAARFAATTRAEFGEAARTRRQRAGRRANGEGYPSPTASGLVGPDALPAECFEQSSIDALLAP